MTLADCPSCDASHTLSKITEDNGVLVCECSCCNAIIQVYPDGSAVERKTDASGHVIHDDP